MAVFALPIVNNEQPDLEDIHQPFHQDCPPLVLEITIDYLTHSTSLCLSFSDSVQQGKAQKM